MASSSKAVEKDYLLSPENLEKSNQDGSSSRWDNDDKGPTLKLRKGMFRSMNLFQKNVFTNKKMKDEPRSATRRTPSIPLVPPPHNGGSRPVSFLERALFPGIKPDVVLPPPSATDPYKTAQLTIFYAGVINVYDDVPIDKAQAVMLLASQSSLSPPNVKDVDKADVVKSVPLSHSPSLCKGQEDLPIARRHSLRCFLDKRRDRIISRCPYAISSDT